MKTYNLFYALMALLVLMGCSKTESDSLGNEKEEEKSVQADYTLLVNNKGNLSGTLFNVEDDALTINPEKSKFASMMEPDLSFQENSVLTTYHKKSNCSGELSIHDFNDDSSKTYQVFSDLGACSLTAKSILRKGDMLYIVYELHVSPTVDEFYVRVLNVSASETTSLDVKLDQRPIELAYANKRLFVLGVDDNVTDENSITVIDANANAVVHSKLVGFDVRRIFTNPDDNIIISYDDLHSTMNSVSLAITHTSYGVGKEPNFTKSASLHFDTEGKMYYEMTPTAHSIFPVIPAIYDFGKNLTVLYAYENFMTETQLNFEFEVEKTTMVSYDEETNVLLIGYKKKSGENKGGLLLVKPAPEPKFLNSIDVAGIPTAIFIN
ncbi:hypothetical protein [Zobellia sp. 1_MG-2023]|uniref:hypothetical protein n=1 Tax=Zobellia sp. 1_MG-2023 TaxID=3062626 RepID=UPI0026E3AFAF|nr:hypothetical protein [Zobellia sp. 1_MG-2023]MDO6819209.1 hypothetical protein [Zobellia sp. 1_MG-2023]